MPLVPVNRSLKPADVFGPNDPPVAVLLIAPVARASAQRPFAQKVVRTGHGGYENTVLDEAGGVVLLQLPRPRGPWCES